MTDQGELAPVQAPKGELQVVSDRLSRAQNAQEIVLWTQVRGEILRQNDSVEERRHRRWMRKCSVLLKPILSSVGILTGAGLVFGDHMLPGLFALGAGFYWLAPDLTRLFFERTLPQNENEDA